MGRSLDLEAFNGVISLSYKVFLRRIYYKDIKVADNAPADHTCMFRPTRNLYGTANGLVGTGA